LALVGSGSITDLHILKGDVPEVTAGRILGHEAVGAGPIGLAAITRARLFSPSHIVAVDLADSRLEAAKHFGADVTVNNGRQDARDAIDQLTGGLGADVASRQVDARPFVTHHFGLDEFPTAYDVFRRAGETGALKVVLTRS